MSLLRVFREESLRDFEPVVLDTPGAPGQPEALETSEEAIVLQWTRPLSDGGAPIQGYVIEKREVGAKEWSKAAFGTVPDTKHRVSALNSEVAGNITDYGLRLGHRTHSEEGVRVPRLRHKRSWKR